MSNVIEKSKVEALIRMYAFDPITLTTAEYEQLIKEVSGRVLAGDGGIGDEILLKIIKDQEYRYNEAKQINLKNSISESTVK